MKPKKKNTIPQSDMLKPLFEDIINPNHALVCLASVIDWERLDVELGQHFASKTRHTQKKRWMGRLNSVEPIIGHLKSDG